MWFILIYYESTLFIIIIINFIILTVKQAIQCWKNQCASLSPVNFIHYFLSNTSSLFFFFKNEKIYPKSTNKIEWCNNARWCIGFYTVEQYCRKIRRFNEVSTVKSLANASRNVLIRGWKFLKAEMKIVCHSQIYL